MKNKTLFLILLASVCSTIAREDTEVFCVYLESCVLPCAFEPGPDPIINWIKTSGDIPIYSIYIDKVQYQDDRYKHRTSLLEEVHTGNASLLLREVKVQDEGRYSCVTSTNHGSVTSFINLKVYVNTFEAAVAKQDLELVCISKGVYPKPAVTWSSGPDLTLTEGRTIIVQREDQLYDVHSSVPQRTSDERVYIGICTVSTTYSWRKAGFVHLGKMLRLYEAIIPCFTPKTPVKSLIWTFNRQSIIYKRTGSERVYNESWRPVVEGITDSNSLLLKNLTTDYEGLYSCLISTDTAMLEVTMKLEILWLPLIYIMFSWSILALIVKSK